MPTALVKDVLYDVSVLLNDTAPQFARYAEQQMVRWLIAAQVAIHKYLPQACARVDAIKLVPGTKQSIGSIASGSVLPGDGSPAETTLGTLFGRVIRNMGPAGTTPGRAIRAYEMETLDAIAPNWHDDESTVIRGFMRDPLVPTAFYVHPGAPSTPAVWVLADFCAEPKTIPNTGTPGAELYAKSGASTTTISVRDEFVQDLVDFCVAHAHMKDTEMAEAPAAVAFMQKFSSSLQAKAAALGIAAGA